ncbi:MAG: hypothetical protein AB7J19_10985, partial [Beijerinckiaceae bacterium]
MWRAFSRYTFGRRGFRINWLIVGILTLPGQDRLNAALGRFNLRFENHRANSSFQFIVLQEAFPAGRSSHWASP